MGTAAIKKGLGTEASEQVRKRAANEGRVGSKARWRAHSGSVSDGDRKLLEGLCEGVAQRGHYNDQVHGTSQAPKKHPITKRGDGLNLPLLRFQWLLYTPAPDQKTPWAAF